MLINLREYHRPVLAGDQGLAQALELLARPDIRTVPLAGGDTLVGSADPTVEAVVDLQGLGLASIAEEGGADGCLSIGAMATRSAVSGHELLRTLFGGMVAEGARRWGGNVQRNRATVGGALAVAASNDPFVVALLACDARVELHAREGRRVVPIADFLSQRDSLLAAPALITRVLLGAEPQTGAGLAAVARTPSDAPIVVAAATITVSDGCCTRARLALGGVATVPVRLPEVEAVLEGQAPTAERIARAAAGAADLVRPKGDYRGSAEYRKAMAAVLSERALLQAWDAARAGAEIAG